MQQVQDEETAADFNPRSREGSDSVAPPEPSPTGYFNPRSREGSDHDVLEFCR